MAKELHIAISAEKLFSFGGLNIANTLFTSFLVTTLFVAFLLYANRQLKHTSNPTRLQSFLEMLVESLYSLVESVTGTGKKLMLFTPIISSFMLFIMLNNWAELIPGFHTIVFTGKTELQLVDLPAWMKPDSAYASTAVEETDTHAAPEEETHAPVEAEAHAEVAGSEEHAEGAEEAHGTTDSHESKGVALFRGANADLNMTLALAIISVTLTQIIGFHFAGLGYLKKFFNFSDPVSAFIGILELVAEFSKIISFAFRLFGNIFAGEVLIGVITFLVPVFLPIPFIGFEIFVGALQAYVFSMLSLVFFNMAASEHHH